jgi:hypothetical protein
VLRLAYLLGLSPILFCRVIDCWISHLGVLRFGYFGPYLESGAESRGDYNYLVRAGWDVLLDGTACTVRSLFREVSPFAQQIELYRNCRRGFARYEELPSWFFYFLFFSVAGEQKTDFRIHGRSLVHAGLNVGEEAGVVGSG